MFVELQAFRILGQKISRCASGKPGLNNRCHCCTLIGEGVEPREDPDDLFLAKLRASVFLAQKLLIRTLM